jgi:hypothetical protein
VREQIKNQKKKYEREKRENLWFQLRLQENSLEFEVLSYLPIFFHLQRSFILCLWKPSEHLVRIKYYNIVSNKLNEAKTIWCPLDHNMEIWYFKKSYKLAIWYTSYQIWFDKLQITHSQSKSEHEEKEIHVSYSQTKLEYGFN